MRLTWLLEARNAERYLPCAQELASCGHKVFLAVVTNVYTGKAAAGATFRRTGHLRPNDGTELSATGVHLIEVGGEGPDWSWLPPSDLLLTDRVLPDDVASLIPVLAVVPVEEPHGEVAGDFASFQAALERRYQQEKKRCPTWSHPSISLCVIAKDESHVIATCLRSAMAVADEIIVVDTGSADDTREIARAFGASVYDFPWTGDFAEARNFALSKASGDWVLYLDADEELEQRDVGRLMRLVNERSCGGPCADGYCFEVISYVGKAAGYEGLIHPTCRLFKNRPEYRFRFRIHEQIAAAISEAGGRLEFAPVRIHHYGYLDPFVSGKDKCRRNLAILEEEVRLNPQNSFNRYNLGVEYLRLKRFDEAIAEFKEAFRLLPSPNQGFASVLIQRMVATLFLMGRYSDALRVAQDGASVYPDYVDLQYFIARCYHAMGDYEAAAAEYRRCLDMARSSWRHPSLMGAGTYLAKQGLAEVYLKAGNRRKARELLMETIMENPDYVRAVVGLIDVLFGNGQCQSEAADLLNELWPVISGNSRTAMVVCRSLMEKGHLRLAARYVDELLRRCQDGGGASRGGLDAPPPPDGRDMDVSSGALWVLKGELLLAAGRYGEALAVFQKVRREMDSPVEAPKPGILNSKLPEPQASRAGQYLGREVAPTVPSCAPAARLNRFGALVGEALAYLGSGDEERFRSCSIRLAAEFPGNPLARALEIFASGLLRPAGQAVAEPEAGACVLDDQVEEAMWGLAGMLLRYGFLKELDPVVRALLHWPGRSYGQQQLRLADLMHSLGYPALAVQHDLEAVRAGVHEARALLRLGRASEALGYLDDAVNFYRAALDLEQDDVRIYLSLGKALLLAKKPDEAESVVREGLRRNPGNNHLQAMCLAISTMKALDLRAGQACLTKRE